ncbi:MAG: 50S ribosomal protein L3 [Candidatus Eisenbacteria bacterium]|nr:50S ribosomal protein L3 [Candidatus Eisenbacteria bacterium]MCC7141943.1 50S ribosomal protein L3 [Candidatus Eisenbacteria bacterium]
MLGLIGKKVGMTQIFSEKGLVIPVTVLEAGPCRIVQVKTAEKDGYTAAQVGFEEVLERKLNKPEKGHLVRHGSGALKHIREFRVTADDPVKSGDTLDVTQFEVGSRVDIISTSKGHGFQGVVKRHHFTGGKETHGSKTNDLPGSIGSSAWPSHVWKGKRLPGQMGNKRITASNLEVVKIDADRNLLLVRGAVPGGSNTLVVIKPSYKSTKRAGR